MINNTNTNSFDSIRIGLASSENVRDWSYGEVTKAETINYRTLKPEKEGLFCERIFGPVKDFECHCGKYKRMRHQGIICDVCGVEVTRSKVRRERMGHIELAAPVSHIWYFKGTTSRLSHFLDLMPKELEKVLYFAENIITFVDEAKREADFETLQANIEEEIGLLNEEKGELLDELDKQLSNRTNWYKTGETDNFDDQDYLWSSKISREKMTEKEIEAGLSQLQKDHERDKKDTEDYIDESVNRLNAAWELFANAHPKQLVADDAIFREVLIYFGSEKTGWGEYIRGGMGAGAIKELIQSIDLNKEIEAVTEELESGKGGQARLVKVQKRLRLLHAFQQSGNKPEWMILDTLPVLPPELRPMVQLDGGRFATSDLNDLYRRVINRNNRLKKLIELDAPDVILANEKRMLQESVDALFDNGRRGAPVTGGSNKRPLKSIADMLKGKNGRFRQNLLGKRVDYSGRSVIVSGPELKLYQCGLPKIMARELFKPFVMSKLVERRIVDNIKSAKRRIDEAQDPLVWDILDEVIKEHPVLLNRAPTLHRLGIQAFEPVLVEGKAIQVHPLVCHAFNADFDGDQMAVHVPLSPEAQAEARLLMLSSRNILSPAHGAPIATPSQDMILGSYYLTFGPEGKELDEKPLRAYRSSGELERKLAAGAISLHEPIKYVPENQAPLNTTVGRVIFHERVYGKLRSLVGEEADRYRFTNKALRKKDLNELINKLVALYGPEPLGVVLDELKQIGFTYATKAGVTISKNDVTIPEKKPMLLEKAEEDVQEIEEQYNMGLISEEERREMIIQRWNQTTNQVSDAMEESFDRNNSIWMMAQSGARGSIRQVSQLAGMRGLMANPKGEIIDRPIRSNFLEGLDMLEYFISTHGARKGLADTALRTADSGYLTRRLVDVSHDIVVREKDCGTTEGLVLSLKEDDKPNPSLLGRLSNQDVQTTRGRTIIAKGEMIDADVLDDLIDSTDLLDLDVRTPLHCKTEYGVCQSCYGVFSATGSMSQIGDAVGVIAAQSIGEPGTQLTMRTFHTGGVAGEDITQGLPRVDELFEARIPKGKAIMSQIEGKVSLETTDAGTKVVVTAEDENSWTTLVARRVRVLVEEGDYVEAGQQLSEGSLDPHELLENHGPDATAKYITREVQKVYRSQGVDINDKHIEVIARQMLRRADVLQAGDSNFLVGSSVEVDKLKETAKALQESGKQPPVWHNKLLGVSKAALSTGSFLSAASFQETTRVLTDAAIEGRIDNLVGLKENIIIGKLIPAATGMKQFRKVSFVGDGSETVETEQNASDLQKMLQYEG